MDIRTERNIENSVTKTVAITTLTVFSLLMCFFISLFRSRTRVGIKIYVPEIVKFAKLAE